MHCEKSDCYKILKWDRYSNSSSAFWGFLIRKLIEEKLFSVARHLKN